MSEHISESPVAQQAEVEYRLVATHQNYRIGTDGSLWRKAVCKICRVRPPGDWIKLNPSPSKDGYLHAILCGTAGKRRVKIQHLVLEAFVGPCPRGLQCRHLDDVKTNNCLSNLCWGTCQENADDAFKNGCRPLGSKIANAKLDEAKAAAAKRLLLNGATILSVARHFDVNPGTIYQVKTGRTWRHVQPAPA